MKKPPGVSPFSEGQRSSPEGAGGRVFGTRASVRAGGGEAAVAWGGGRRRTKQGGKHPAKQGEKHPASIPEGALGQGEALSDSPASAAAAAWDKQLSLAPYSSLKLFLEIVIVI